METFPARAAQQLKRYPRLYRLGRELWTAGTSRLTPRTLAGVPGRVHRSDLMLDSADAAGAAAYAAVGAEAVERIGEALAAAQRDWAQLDEILDFGCGHGRVLRWLAQQAPPTAITACDLDRGAVEFCQAEFGVKGLVSNLELAGLSLGNYDLIWAGSVATHLPEQAWRHWVEVMSRSLRPTGVLVFTAHDPSLIPAHADKLGDAEQVRELEAAAAATGFAYAPYSYYGSDAYGLAYHSKDRLVADAAATGLRLIYSRPRGWASHQDVYAFRPAAA